MTTCELAYLAGLFDGEGHVGLYQNANGTIVLRVCLGIAHEETIRWIGANFPGTVGTNRKSLPDKNAQVWKWQCCTLTPMKQVLSGIIPFLRVKKDQVELALAYLDLPRAAHNSEDKLQRLLFMQALDELRLKERTKRSSSMIDVEQEE